jgi:hypothetical protein
MSVACAVVIGVQRWDLVFITSANHSVVFAHARKMVFLSAAAKKEPNKSMAMQCGVYSIPLQTLQQLCVELIDIVDIDVVRRTPYEAEGGVQALLQARLH